MRVVELSDRFGLDGLTLVTRPDPTPGRDELVVRMHAASLNYRDLEVVRGTYGNLSLPLIPVSDGAGEVVSVGPEVQRFHVGDRVCPIYVRDWLTGPPTAEGTRRRLGGPLDGVLAEYVCVSERAVVRQPRHLSHAESATLPIAGVTAWTALFEEGHLRPGDTVVVQGTGGVSVFALQLGKLAGASVIVTSSSEDKLDRARALGAAATINYRRHPEWQDEVLRLTDRRGADQVIEVVGGANLARSVTATRVGGRISLVGYLGGIHADLDVRLVLRRMVTIQALSVGSRAAFEALIAGLETGGVRPILDRAFPFPEVRPAFEHLASGRHFGKVAIDFP